MVCSHSWLIYDNSFSASSIFHLSTFADTCPFGCLLVFFNQTDFFFVRILFLVGFPREFSLQYLIIVPSIFLFVWSLSDLWKDFFPKPSRELSTFTEEEKLEFEFWGLLDCPSDCFPSHRAGLAGTESLAALTVLRERC